MNCILFHICKIILDRMYPINGIMLEKVKIYFCYTIVLYIMQCNVNHIKYIVDTSNSR